MNNQTKIQHLRGRVVLAETLEVLKAHLAQATRSNQPKSNQNQIYEQMKNQ